MLPKASSRGSREAALRASTPQHVEYICTYCGQKFQRSASVGRPMPGRCPARSTQTKKYPHTWVINRKW